MEWINVWDRLPEQKQLVWYFSPILGLWRGVYERRVPEYLLTDDENGNTIQIPIPERTKAAINPEEFSCGAGNCDTDEVTHWMPYDEAHAETGWVPLPPGYTPPRMSELRKHLMPPGYTPPRMSELRKHLMPPISPPPPADWVESATELFVDPPSGWRYGFPKVWNKVTHPDLTAWLIENGYPEKSARANLPMRFWQASEVSE